MTGERAASTAMSPSATTGRSNVTTICRTGLGTWSPSGITRATLRSEPVGSTALSKTAHAACAMSMPAAARAAKPREPILLSM